MNLNLIAPVNSLGYGQVGSNILHALERYTDIKTSFFPISPIRREDAKDIYETLAATMKRAQTPDFYAPCIRIWHQHDMSQFVGSGWKIGFPIFELDKFTKQEKHHLVHLDKIMVCSEWAKDVVCKELCFNPSDVYVIPLGVNSYDITDAPPVEGKTRFFTCGKWEIRKGHDVLIKAFNEAFSDEDNVELHMMCNNPFLDAQKHKEWENMYLDSELGHKVRFVPRVESHREVLSIMSSMDCGVFISRAEGWNLELLEMMSLGKSVIATNYSGHTQFCNKYNSMLVEIENTEVANDGIWFKGSGNWAELGPKQVSAVADHMRSVHEAKISGIDISNPVGIETGKKLTWENTAKEIVNVISGITNI